jgi:Zn-dependent protease with chaperone function
MTWAIGLALTLFTMPTGAASRVISEADEIRAGRDASAEFEKEEVMCADPALNAKVQRIGRRLAAVSDRPNLPFQFKVVDTSDVNAVAFPGGFIYVYRGLVEIMPSDDALAAVIGHEITHATHRHWARGTENDWLLNLITLPLLKTPVASTGSVAGRMLATLGFSRHAEGEADREGFVYLVRAGYDPQGAVQAWETMLRFSPDKKKEMKLLRTHPLSEARLETLRQMAKEAKINRPVSPPSPSTSRAVVPLADTPASRFSPWMPLSPGTRWTYRATTPEGKTQHTEWTVEGEVPEASGAVRLTIQLPQDVTLHPWLLSTGSALNMKDRPSDPKSGWRMDTPLPAPDSRLETVTVPAGAYKAASVTKPLSGGATVTVWFVEGIGVVKREYRPSGLTEELVSFDQPQGKASSGEDNPPISKIGR